MSDIRLSLTTHDIELENNDLVLTSGIRATRQRLKQRLQLLFAEWFLDTSRGVPYFQQIFQKQANSVVVESVFKREILEDQAVIELRRFELDIDATTRILTIDFNALTDEGLVDFSESFGFSAVA